MFWCFGVQGSIPRGSADDGLSQLRTVAQLTNKMFDDVWRTASRFKRAYLPLPGACTNYFWLVGCERN